MAIKKRPVSPRQKMINLMYVVLMAMLALNVSNEVLDGFTLVQESLQRTTENASRQNLESFNTFIDLMAQDSAGVRPWYDKAARVKIEADSLYNLAEELKIAIVKQADGPNGDLNNIIGKDDLESAARVMLADGVGRGKELEAAISKFRSLMLELVKNDKQKKEFVEKAIQMDINRSFESMPVAAAITLLSKLQSDVRYAEGETFHDFIARYKHNEEPYFKPEPPMPGLIIAQPKISNAPVNRNISMVPNEPAHSATTANKMMNVLYAGYDNPLSFTVSGVPQSSVSVTMEGGSVTSNGDGTYIARPTAAGTPAIFTVTANGQEIGKYEYKVRPLPPPSPYIAMGVDRYKGGRISKSAIMNAAGIGAAIDDGLLDIEFRVNSFSCEFLGEMNTVVPIASNGASFSDQQKRQIRQLSPGQRFLIKNVNATGPDGITRTLTTSMEVRIK
ncbi:MAG: gliding motility protein GldM [Bacteroidaceae bacterium]|nr:gliding motility protein GldM [Bacteroidaceae bacterium]